MMYLHYCNKCDTIRMLNGHKPTCPACASPLCELKTSFTAYTSMSQQERTALLYQIRKNNS